MKRRASTLSIKSTYNGENDDDTGVLIPVPFSSSSSSANNGFHSITTTKERGDKKGNGEEEANCIHTGVAASDIIATIQHSVSQLLSSALITQNSADASSSSLLMSFTEDREGKGRGKGGVPFSSSSTTDEEELEEWSLEEYRAAAWYAAYKRQHEHASDTRNTKGRNSPVSFGGVAKALRFSFAPSSSSSSLSSSSSFAASSSVSNPLSSALQVSSALEKQQHHRSTNDASLVHIMSRLYEERVQLQAQLAQREIEVEEKDDLLLKLRETLTESFVSITELESVAKAYLEAVVRAQELENTNIELTVLAKCARITKKNHDDDDDDDDDERGGKEKEEGEAHDGADRYEGGSDLQNKPPMYVRVWRINRETKRPRQQHRVDAEEEKVITQPVTGTTMSTDAKPVCSCTPIAVQSDISLIQQLQNRVTFLEQELDTAALAREILFSQLKETREKARAAQMEIIEKNEVEMSRLKAEHMKAVGMGVKKPV